VIAGIEKPVHHGDTETRRKERHRKAKAYRR
jgi:hypothetical protein